MLRIPAVAFSFALLTCPAIAMADDHGDDDEDLFGSGEEDLFGGDDDMGAGASADASLEVDATVASPGVGPFTKENYPTSLLERPLTLPAGMIEVSPELFHMKLFLDLGPIGSVEFDATGLGVGANYGITDQIQAGVATSLLLDPEFEWGKVLMLSGAYLALDGDKLDIAATAELPLDFNDEADVLAGVRLGANTRFVLSDMLFLRAGQGALPINFDPFIMNLDLNVGVGIQATPQLAFVLDTQLASLALAGDGNETTTLGDFIPIILTGFFGINQQFDAFLSATFPSIEDAGDFYVIQAGANIRI